MSKLKAVVAAGLLAMAGVANANLIQNGSFEDNTQAAGTWGIYSSLAGGWVGLPDVELRNGVAGTAHQGSNFVELDTYLNSAIRQSFTVVTAGVYTLSFFYQSRPESLDPATYGLTVDVTPWNSSTNTSSGFSVLQSTITHGSSTPWTQFSQTFNAVAGTYMLRIGASGIPDGFGTSVDSVAVVPEPGTIALMLAGLGVVGWMARRRQAGSAVAVPMAA